MASIIIDVCARFRERPFHSAGTFSFVADAPHSLEVLNKTLQKKAKTLSTLVGKLDSTELSEES